jgi:hypothetical protein
MGGKGGGGLRGTSWRRLGRGGECACHECGKEMQSLNHLVRRRCEKEDDGLSWEGDGENQKVLQ